MSMESTNKSDLSFAVSLLVKMFTKRVSCRTILSFKVVLASKAKGHRKLIISDVLLRAFEGSHINSRSPFPNR